MSFLGNSGLVIPLRNDAVRLWDGSNTANTTQLSSANPIVDQTVLLPVGLLSFWLKQTQGTFRITTQQSPGDERGIVFQFSGNNGYFSATDTSGNPLLQVFPNIFPSYSSNWKHFLLSWNFTGSSVELKICVNDNPTFSASNNSNIYTLFQRTPFAINYQGSSPAELYDFWHGQGSPNDAYDINVRRKFIDASLNPVKLGSKGQLPFGSIPRLFYSGSFSNWRKNKGALGLAELSPSNPANFTKSPDKPT